MNNTLYKIEQQYLQLINTIEENEGEITPEIEQALTITQADLEKKSLSYLSVIKAKESFNEQIDAEIKRLQALKNRNSNLVEHLKNRLLGAVNMFGKFTIGTLTFGTRKSKSVEVEDVNSLPIDYKTIEVTETANKVEIKKALKSGVKIKGCQLVENLNLKIK